MKCKNNFFLRKIGDIYFLQCSDSYDHKVIFLNETGVFLWEKLIKCASEEDLVNDLISVYNVQHSRAEEDVANFLAFLIESGCLTREGEVESATV